MFWRMVFRAVVRQWKKMLMVAFTVALGASLATAMLNVMFDVGDKVNQELKAYGANIRVVPQAAGIMGDLYGLGADAAQYLREDELGRLKTIFWAFNIVDFAPYLEGAAHVCGADGTPLPEGGVTVVGTWFRHHLSLPTGEEMDTGMTAMKQWWSVEGEWLSDGAGAAGTPAGAESDGRTELREAGNANVRRADAGSEPGAGVAPAGGAARGAESRTADDPGAIPAGAGVMVGAELARRLGVRPGDVLFLSAPGARGAGSVPTENGVPLTAPGGTPNAGKTAGTESDNISHVATAGNEPAVGGGGTPNAGDASNQSARGAPSAGAGAVPAAFTVRGVFEAGGDEDECVYMALSDAQRLFGRPGLISSIEVSALTTPDNDLARKAAQDPGSLNRVDWDTWYCTAYVSSICYQIQEVISNSVAKAVRQVAESEGAILSKTQLLMMLITILSLIGSALGISNLVTASVMERSKEIGLLKAIGAHDFPVSALVLTEILITALLGGVAGYFAGLGFAQVIGQSVFGSAVAVKPTVIPLVSILILVVTLAGSLPSVRLLLSLDPADVLHGGH